MIFSSEYFILDISLWIFLKNFSAKKSQKWLKNGQKLINIFWNVDIKINGRSYKSHAMDKALSQQYSIITYIYVCRRVR